MKKILRIFVVIGILAPCVSFGAVTVHKKSAVNKKASVETQQSSGLSAATSLLPAVTGLVGGVMQLKKEQQELGKDCAPNSGEINLVNDLIKEWAKSGDTDANGAANGWDPCIGSYQNNMQQDGEKTCVDKFNEPDRIWNGYPQASMATVGKKTYSNVYDIFARIPFVTNDYTQSEASQIKALIEKTDRCAPSKLSAKKRELLGGFLTNTISSVGSSAGVSGVSDVMQMAGQMGGSGGGVSSMLGNFGSMVPSLLPQ